MSNRETDHQSIGFLLSAAHVPTDNLETVERQVYVPDDAALVYSLSGLLPIVVLRREQETVQLALLQQLFGENRIRRLSEAPLQPVAHSDLEQAIGSAPHLLEDFRWLGLVALSVLAFGRSSREMKLDGREFRAQIAKLRRVKIARVKGLALLVSNSEHKPFICHYWSDRETLLVSTDRLENLGEVAAGFKAIFEVADVEDALARALDVLPPNSLDSSETPSEDEISAALGRIRVGVEQVGRVQRSLLEDKAWTAARCSYYS